jgi:hypothetical protein
MKFINTYEKIISKNTEINYNPGDFYKIPYWRYRHSSINSIFKVEYKIRKSLADANECNLTLVNLGTYEVNTFLFNDAIMHEIAEVKDHMKILRPATESEIEVFNKMVEESKFNI